MSVEDLKRQLEEAQKEAREATQRRINSGNDWAKAERERENAVSALAKVDEERDTKENRLAQMLEVAVRNALFQENAEIEALNDKVNLIELKLDGKKDYDDTELRDKCEELEYKMNFLLSSFNGKLDEKDKEIQELKERLAKQESKTFFQRLFGR